MEGQPVCDEEFGFVKRDSALLEKALTSPAAGSTEQQVEDSPEEDVTSSGRKLGGKREDNPDLDRLGNVYDASKRKETAVSTTPRPGFLRRISSKSGEMASGLAKEEELPQTFQLMLTKPIRRDIQSKQTTGPQNTKSSGHKKAVQRTPAILESQVKYLGMRDARGLWGIKHTRKPVDNMVDAAKTLKPGTVLPLVKLVVSKEGVSVIQIPGDVMRFHAIDSISYGVQDLVYTRVFSMIVVKEFTGQHPFECHAFVCDSRTSARRLTYALASAFHEYSLLVKAAACSTPGSKPGYAAIRKKFAIDLRTPEEIAADLKNPEDSEA